MPSHASQRGCLSSSCSKSCLGLALQGGGNKTTRRREMSEVISQPFTDPLELQRTEACVLDFEVVETMLGRTFVG